ncbi:RNA polymerase sigma factor [Butyricimonas synergistica]|uniref:RNA polymerase sigma factor n=1 Tax=Butyricimonas synergistica TaxID=544644 RepID=UPI0003665BEF|nr:RNA polymerase sigma factor [Butyricimonas synergistica]
MAIPSIDCFLTRKLCMCEKLRIKAILEGDQRAFKDLVDDYKVIVVNTCYAFVHDKEEAEDLAQEVFIQVYESLDKFRGECKLSTWLYRIAVNKAINYKKSVRYRMKRIRLEGDSSISIASKDDLAQEKIEKEEIISHLHQAIKNLPERQRIALVLNKYEERPYKEVAEIMGISLASVESLLFRAKSYLEKYFSNYKNDLT